MSRYLLDTLDQATVVVCRDDEDTMFLEALAQRVDGEPNRPRYQLLSLFDARIAPTQGALGYGFAPLEAVEDVTAENGDWIIVSGSGVTVTMPPAANGAAVMVTGFNSHNVSLFTPDSQFFGAAGNGITTVSLGSDQTTVAKCILVGAELCWILIA